MLIAAVNVCCGWLLKSRNAQTWKRTWRQLTFNLGMDTVAICVSSWLWLGLRALLGPNTLIGQILPWLAAAICYTQLNLALLIGITWLQPGAQISPLQMWREESWSSQIDLLLMASGGLFAYAIGKYDWLAILAFFLPIALSAYAFRLYVGQMNEHMNRLDQIIDERTQELVTLNEQKDYFLSLLSHDMMTPLTNIRLSAELIQEENASEESRHLLQSILYSQNILHHLVRNIVDLSELQAVGMLPMHKALFNLHDLLSSVCALMMREAAEKDITLTTDLGQSQMWIDADLSHIERIFLNLISNATKYTPDGGTVHVKACTDAHWVVVTVSDNGYGIAAEELPLVFERFQRAKRHQLKALGNGLGLAIAKAFIEQHGGTIAVSSKENNGSTFTIKLPLKDIEADPLETEAEVGGSK